MHIMTSRWKLLAIIAAILISGFLAVNLANYYVSASSVRSALLDNELPLTSNNIYSEIQASLLRPIYISSLMANDTFLKDWMVEGEQDVSKITRYLGEIRSRYDVASTFLVSANSGLYYHYEGVLKSMSPHVPKDSWFFSMKEHRGNYRVDVDSNEAKQNILTIFVNHKLHDYQGQFIGVTGIGLEVGSVAEMIDRYMQEYKRTIYFVDREGQIKSHHDRSLIDRLNILKMPGIETVAGELLAGSDDIVMYPRGDDNVMLSYRFIPELDWFLLVEQTENEALQPLRHALYLNMAISAVVTLLVVLVSGLAVNKYHSRLESMARIDKLTGLYNRQYFDALFEHAMGGLGRQISRLTLVLLDVDNLKRINDEKSHLAGDEYLKGVAMLARDNLRKNDVIARWGGDEFAILLQECDAQTAAGLMEKIRERVEASLQTLGAGLPVSISVGVAEYEAGDSCNAMLARADRRLYRAKSEGRNRVVAS